MTDRQGHEGTSWYSFIPHLASFNDGYWGYFLLTITDVQDGVSLRLGFVESLCSPKLIQSSPIFIQYLFHYMTVSTYGPSMALLVVTSTVLAQFFCIFILIDFLANWEKYTSKLIKKGFGPTLNLTKKGWKHRETPVHQHPEIKFTVSSSDALWPTT